MGKNILLSLLEQLVCLLCWWSRFEVEVRGKVVFLLLALCSLIKYLQYSLSQSTGQYCEYCTLWPVVSMARLPWNLSCQCWQLVHLLRIRPVGQGLGQLCVLGFIRGEYPWTPLPRPCGLQRMQWSMHCNWTCLNSHMRVCVCALVYVCVCSWLQS